jgi:hypothetical protein
MPPTQFAFHAVSHALNVPTALPVLHAQVEPSSKEFNANQFAIADITEPEEFARSVSLDAPIVPMD